MQTVRIYRLEQLSATLFRRLKAAQMEAAQVGNLCMETHKQARMSHTHWPGGNELHQATKGRFSLHSQSGQPVFPPSLPTINPTPPFPKHPPKIHIYAPAPTN